MNDVTLRAFVEGKVSRQQFLDFVYAKLKEQGRPAYAEGRCLYNGPDGTHCGIGWTILNEGGYRPREGCSVVKVLKELGLWKTRPDDLDFLEDVQKAHDEASKDQFLISLCDNFAWTAHRYRLIPPK